MNSLQQVVDNFLGYPKSIHCKNGKIRVRTSAKMIEKGQVCVNGHVRSDSGYPVTTGDYVKFGMDRYKEHFIVP